MSKEFPAVALTGPRQSGKSTILKHLFNNKGSYVTFDDPLTREKAKNDPKGFLSSLKTPMIFDEIQYVPELLSYLKILIDNNRSKKGQYIITGSQKFSLIKNLGDSLAGRIGLLNLLAFSKNEKATTVNFNNIKNPSTMDYFIDACLRGSYPEISTDYTIDFESWYGSYLQTYIERDVRTIYEIGNLHDFGRFIQILATRCGQILDLTGLSNDIGVAVNTIKKWISILEASSIIFLLYPYYGNLGKRIIKSPKIYFLDCGLVCYLTGIRDKKVLLQGPLLGNLFENYVIQEVVKAFANNGRKVDIYYLRTSNQLEIDLIIEKNTQIIPIEIKATKTLNLSMANSIERYMRLYPKLNMSVGKIISFDDQEELLFKNVSTITLDNLVKLISR